jgi:hypothetical protein
MDDWLTPKRIKRSLHFEQTPADVSKKPKIIWAVDSDSDLEEKIKAIGMRLSFFLTP